jgi:Tfp pilus assembly PilM family ATPase
LRFLNNLNPIFWSSLTAHVSGQAALPENASGQPSGKVREKTMPNKDISSTENLLEVIRGKKDIARDFAAQPGNHQHDRRIASVVFDPKKTSVGISVSLEGVYVVAVEHVHAGTRIVDYRFIANKSNQPLAARAVGELLLNAGVVEAFQMKKTANWFLISSESIEFGTLSLPRSVDSKEVPNAVFWAAKKKTPFEESDVIFNYYQIDICTEKGIDKTRFGTYTVPRQNIQEILAIFQALDVPLEGITCFPLSASCLLRAQGDTTNKGIVAVVNVKSEWSSIDLFNDNVLAFSRRIRTGEVSFVDSIRERSGMVLVPEQGTGDEEGEERVSLGEMSREEAAEILHAHLKGSASTPEEHTDIMDLVEPAAQRLVSQIERTFAYFRTTMQVPAPVKLVFVGRIAAFRSLIEYIGAQLAMETETLDPFALPGLAASIPVPKSSWYRSGYTCACAAALASSTDGFNLLYSFRDRIRSKRLAAIHRAAVMGFVGALAVLLVVFAWFGRERSQKRAEYASLAKELAMYPEDVTPAQTLGLLASLKKHHSYLQTYTHRFGPVAAFAEIASITPSTIRISSILNENGEDPGKPGSLVIDGYVIGESDLQDSYLSNYLVTLNKSPLFADPAIQRREGEEGSDGKMIHFVVSVTIS